MSLRRLFTLAVLGNLVLIAGVGSIGLLVGLRAYRSLQETSEMRMPRALAISRLRDYGTSLIDHWNEYFLLVSGAKALPAAAPNLIREAYAVLVDVNECHDALRVWYKAYRDLNPTEKFELEVCDAVDSLLRLSQDLHESVGDPSTAKRTWKVRGQLEGFDLHFSDVMKRAMALERERVRNGQSVAEAAVQNGLYVFAGLAALGLVGSVLLGTLLAKRTAGPIVSLAKAARKVSDGDLGVRVATDVGGEIGVLAESFNHMVERLQEMTVELESSNQALREELVERRRAERQLQEERNLLRAVIDHIPDAICFKDQTGRYRIVNRPFLSLVGLKEPELTGRGNDQIPKSAIGDLLRDVEQEIVGSGKPVLAHEGIVEDGDGRSLVLLTSGVPVYDAEGRFSGTVLFMRDVTRQRKAEQQIRESEQRFRAVFETAPVGMFLADTSGKVLAVNDALLQIMGSPSKELTMGLNVLTHPHLRKMGFSEPIEKCIRTGNRVSKELTYRSVWGKDVEIVLYLSPILDEGGEVRLVQGIIDDTTERKRLQRQLLQAQKMEAIGRLAGGIAHDFNNIMTGILGYCQFLLADCPETDPRHADLQEIEKLAKRAASLTQQLLAFSRQQVLQPQPLNLNDLVRDMDKMLRRLIGEHIELRLELASDLPLVEIDPVQMQQVVMNLAVNARDAMPQGGVLTVETRTIDVDDEFAARHVDLRTGQYVSLSVSDTGTGMDEETKSRAFEPFFTTKKVGEGTGLGLSTVKGIVEQSGGRVWLYSELGKGTTVKIFLPAIPSEREERETVQEEGGGQGWGTETILFVEDEEAIRDMVHRALTRLGYRVLVASDAGEALRICEEYDGKIDLLLTDVVMPRMNGRELADEIQKRFPHVRVLFTSGYTDSVVAHEHLVGANSNFIQKPYTPVDLAKTIRRVLSEG